LKWVKNILQINLLSQNSIPFKDEHSTSVQQRSLLPYKKSTPQSVVKKEYCFQRFTTPVFRDVFAACSIF